MDTAASLGFLCHCLSPRAEVREGLERQLRSGAIHWQEVIHLAGHHLVTPSLEDSIGRHGLFDLLPTDVQDYLNSMRTLNLLRNWSFRDELVNIAATLNGIGIEPVVLKGAIALLPDPYPGALNRVIGDIDLLVPGEAVREAYAVLAASGYLAAPQDTMLLKDRKRMHHVEPLLHPGLPIAVELHSRILHNHMDDAWLQAWMAEPEPVPLGGSHIRVPDLGTRLLHNFLHTHIQDRGSVHFSVEHRQLLEFVHLREFAGSALDWRKLADRLQPGRLRELAVYLLMAEHWYGQPYPAELPKPAGSRLAFGLTRRIQTSTAWSRAFSPYIGLRRYLPGVLNLPHRLLTPSWFVAKYRSRRRAELPL